MSAPRLAAASAAAPDSSHRPPRTLGGAVVTAVLFVSLTVVAFHPAGLVLVAGALGAAGTVLGLLWLIRSRFSRRGRRRHHGSSAPAGVSPAE